MGGLTAVIRKGSKSMGPYAGYVTSIFDIDLWSPVDLELSKLIWKYADWHETKVVWVDH